MPASCSAGSPSWTRRARPARGSAAKKIPGTTARHPAMRRPQRPGRDTVIFGIGLGTTNSLIAWLKDGVPTTIANVHGQVLTPSAVSVDDAGSLRVGGTAREGLGTAPKV